MTNRGLSADLGQNKPEGLPAHFKHSHTILAIENFLKQCKHLINDFINDYSLSNFLPFLFSRSYCFFLKLSGGEGQKVGNRMIVP